jgi:hypothetical protein
MSRIIVYRGEPVRPPVTPTGLLLICIVGNLMLAVLIGTAAFLVSGLSQMWR